MILLLIIDATDFNVVVDVDVADDNAIVVVFGHDFNTGVDGADERAR